MSVDYKANLYLGYKISSSQYEKLSEEQKNLLERRNIFHFTNHYDSDLGDVIIGVLVESIDEPYTMNLGFSELSWSNEYLIAIREEVESIFDPKELPHLWPQMYLGLEVS